MKILIIGSRRSGSTNLFNAVGRGFNLPPHSLATAPGTFSPSNLFLDEQKCEEVRNMTDCVVRIHEDWRIEKFKRYSGFILYANTLFDEIIFHTRANTYEAALSMTNGLATENFHWGPSKYTRVVEEPTLLQIGASATAVSNIIKAAKVLNKPVSLYEDLFSGNKDKVEKIINSWNIDKNLLNYDKFYSYLDPSKKYSKNL